MDWYRFGWTQKNHCLGWRLCWVLWESCHYPEFVIFCDGFIRTSTFLQVSPELQNDVLMSLLETDPDVVDYLLRRKASQLSWVFHCSRHRRPHWEATDSHSKAWTKASLIEIFLVEFEQEIGKPNQSTSLDNMPIWSTYLLAYRNFLSQVFAFSSPSRLFWIYLMMGRVIHQVKRLLVGCTSGIYWRCLEGLTCIFAYLHTVTCCVCHFTSKSVISSNSPRQA